MKNLAKLITLSIFALGAVFIFLSSQGASQLGLAAFSIAAVQPTPTVPKITPTVTSSQVTPKPSNAPTAASSNTPAATSRPEVNKNLLMLDEGGRKGTVPFDHDAHAFEKNYSVDGNSNPGCVKCHHTDKPPMREEAMTYVIWQGWDKTKKEFKVKGCKDCHINQADKSDENPIPTASNCKVCDDEEAYHVNCTECHAEAKASAEASKRPKLKNGRGFATKSPGQCFTCHS